MTDDSSKKLCQTEAKRKEGYQHKPYGPNVIGTPMQGEATPNRMTPILSTPPTHTNLSHWRNFPSGPCNPQSPNKGLYAAQTPLPVLPAFFGAGCTTPSPVPFHAPGMLFPHSHAHSPMPMTTLKVGTNGPTRTVLVGVPFSAPTSPLLPKLHLSSPQSHQHHLTGPTSHHLSQIPPRYSPIFNQGSPVYSPTPKETENATAPRRHQTPPFQTKESQDSNDTDDDSPASAKTIQKPMPPQAFELSNVPISAEETETDVERLTGRRKQIRFGRGTEGYRRYLLAVPKSTRQWGNPAHPLTPRAEFVRPRRQFKRAIQHWRQSLHIWDDESLIASATFQPHWQTLSDLGYEIPPLPLWPGIADETPARYIVSPPPTGDPTGTAEKDCEVEYNLQQVAPPQQPGTPTRPTVPFHDQTAASPGFLRPTPVRRTKPSDEEESSGMGSPSSTTKSER